MSDVPTFSFVLDGQGIPASTNQQTINTAQEDARTPLGAAVLLSCYQAFVKDLATLTPEEQHSAGLTLADVPVPDALLALPQLAAHNAVVGNVHLYLVQVLRYAARVAGAAFPRAHPALGVLGFSTGMLAAAVIACADTVPNFVRHATEAFRLAFWLGLRAQQYAARALPAVPLPDAPAQAWTLITFGASRAEVEDAVAKFNADKASPEVFLTAMTNDTCASVSGRPDALHAFRHGHLPASAIQARSAAIHTLYHTPALQSVKEQIMRDVAAHGVRFPAYDDLRVTLRSTLTGEAISSAGRADGYTLAEELVDMTMLHPVNFDKVLAAIKADLASTPSEAPVSLVNLGPGNVLWRSTARALPDVRFHKVDWSASGRPETVPRPFPETEAKKDVASAREPIAIVGMAVKLPGAVDAAGLWQVLEQGLNTVSEVPKQRFNVEEYNAGAHGATRGLKTRFGNFMDDPDAFDNVFFRVSPREARSMDPQQRLLLHVAYHALENAGYVPGATPTFDPDTFATYVGVATNDYVQNLRNAVDVYYSTGTLHAFLSGKLSYAFKFSGPSLVIDTACSSSMVSVYQACRALTNGDCNAALAGGVNVIASPDMYLGLDRAHFLSSTGNCKPWDASADGYCRAEGCGMFVLKRLSDAVRENDNILGVIRGIEVNQSAHADSITQPHVPTQIDLFRKLTTSTGIEPTKISVIEAHGTGTKAGDPTEIRSIRTVFAPGRTPANPLHMTSIKANIGHAEAASGAASLAKLLLMLRNRTIPAVISLKNLNPNIRDLEADNTVIPTANVPWPAPADGGKRLALLNNFGAAGSNAALILEEAEARPASLEGAAPAFVVGVSCDSEEALETQRAAYIRQLEEHVHDAAALTDFAYTATARRQPFRYRVAAAGRTRDEVVAELRRAQVMQVGDAGGKTVFVFSGQGGQYAGMGATMYRTLPAFRRVVDECHAKLVAWGYPGILGIINPAEGQIEEDFRAFQSAVFVLEYALAEMWKSWGVTPDAVAGHSLGEYAALVVAGVLSLNDGLKLVAGRANLMGEKCAPNETGMLAVKMSPSELAQHIAKSADYDQLSVACHNSCDDGVIAGKLTQIDQLQAELKAAGRKCVKVNVPYGYHTSAMAPILGDITALASQVKLNAPSIPVVSNVHGTVVSAGDASVFTPEYFARHCGEPVKFEQGIHDLMARDDFVTVSAWIEIGPHPTSLPMLRSIPATSNQAMYLPTLKKNADDWHVICGSLASLYCTKNSVNWRAVFADLGPNARVAELPAYPFAKTKFWIKFEEGAPAQTSTAAAPAAAPGTRFSLLGSVQNLPPPGSAEPARFETTIDKVAHLIEGHQVVGHGLCPASVYIEMASAAAQLVLENHGRVDDDSTIALSEITFSNPLVYSPDVARTIRIEIALGGVGDKHTGRFTVSSFVADPAKPQPHCAGVVDLSSKSRTKTKFGLSSTTVERRQKSVVESRNAETFYTRTAYDIIFSRIVAYNSTYHTMKSITIDSNGVDAYAVVQLPEKSASGTFVAHPVFMDTLLHAVGFVINCNAGNNEAFICSQVDKVKVIPELVKKDAKYGVYCNIGFLSDSVAVGDAYAFELGTSPVVMVAQMKRMQFKKLRMSGFKAILASAAAHSGAGHSAAPSRTSGARPASVSPKRVTVAAPAPSSNVQKIKEIMAGVLGVPVKDIAEDQDLERLGLDSLTSIEAHHALCSTLGTELPEKLFSSCKTINDIIAAVGLPATPASPVSSTPRASESTLHEQDNTAVDVNRAATLAKVQEVLASVLGVSVKDLGDNTDLELMGMDSLMSIEALHALSTALGSDLPQDLFSTCKTIREIQDVVSPAFKVATAPSAKVLSVAEPVAAAGGVDASATMEKVKGIMASVLGVALKDLGEDKDLERLGMDSLMSIEALHALATELDVTLPQDLFTTCKTIRQIQDIIAPPSSSPAKALPTATSERAASYGTDVNPVLLQDGNGSSAPPLFLVHDGSGIAHQYGRISSLGRQVWGIHNPKFPTGGKWDGGLMEMAEHYVGLIKGKLNGSTECLVGGWSIGGVVAFEVARRLIASGINVPGLVLIDSPHPETTTPLSDDVINAAFATHNSPSRAVELARSSIQHATAALVKYDPSSSPAKGFSPKKAVMLRSREGFRVKSTDLNSQSDAFLADRADPATMVREWEKCLGTNVPVFDIPGNHFEVFDPRNVGEVSAQLVNGLKLL